jgi:hypothetical protein
MTQKFIDPYSFLRNLLTKKGKSDLEGVYLASVNVAADVQTDYGYEISSYDVERRVRKFYESDSAEWNALLVSMRRFPLEIAHSFVLKEKPHPTMVTFISDGSELSCNVCSPSLVLDEFVTEVAVFQQLTQEVAKFAGKIPTTLRFSFGVVTVFWDDLVEWGEAREVDVGF